MLGRKRYRYVQNTPFPDDTTELWEIHVRVGWFRWEYAHKGFDTERGAKAFCQRMNRGRP